MALKSLPSLQPETSRRTCGTCLFYQASPLRNQGWCRNPTLHSPDERALVSNDEHRCMRMLTDFWQPATGQPTRLAEPKAAPTTAKRRTTTSRTTKESRLPAVPMPVVYLLVIMLVAIGAGVIFSTQTSRANTEKATKATASGVANVDFWLRDDSRSDAAKKSIILMGTPLQLVNSKAGEIMDANSEAPAKWYYIRVEATGETGWVYSAWIDRKP